MITKCLTSKVISKNEYHFLNISQPNKPLFYHLPKIHKDLQNPPGHPIISGIRSTTSNLSQYLDTILQTYVRKQQSFLKDSDDLIRLIFKTPWSEGLSYRTMDVSALYSNINHKLGIDCVNKILLKDPEIPPIQREFITDSLRFILENNFFTFGDSTY